MKSAIQLHVVLFLILQFAAGAAALEIALSNDDGWSAPGIQAMKTALEKVGHRVTLAGPLDEQSGSSAAGNFVSDLIITKQSPNEYSVATAEGTEGSEPATSALIAIGIAKEANGGVAPDLLVMGINTSANIGAATQFSGTVGGTIAAIASYLNGSLSAIAISTDEPCDTDHPPGGELAACKAANDEHFADVASFVADFIAHLETRPGLLANEPRLLPPGIALNINYPPVPPGDIQGVSLNVQGKLWVRRGTPLVIDFACFACSVIPVGASSPGGIRGAGFDPTPDVPDSDAASFNAGFITIVPIAADYTADKWILEGFEKVIKEFNDEDSDRDSRLLDR